MSARILSHRYGKGRVRVLKILRTGAVHAIKELDVTVSLDGDFESAYTAGDNSKIVATDTVKNTINVLAHRHLGEENERFVLLLARHFLEKYPQVSAVSAMAVERAWQRLQIAAKPHPHSFAQTQGARPFTRVDATREEHSIQSGIEDLLILKSTESAFEGYPACEFTTLPETKDRILATSLSATWAWSGEPANYATSDAAILDAMLVPFAEKFSPSVQATLFEMGSAALEACAEISKIHLSMPNKHCLLIDLKPFSIENKNELFVPVEEPQGQIEATVGR